MNDQQRYVQDMITLGKARDNAEYDFHNGFYNNSYPETSDEYNAYECRWMEMEYADSMIKANQDELRGISL